MYQALVACGFRQPVEALNPMRNISIIGKFLTIIAVFGVFVIGVAVYTTDQIQSVGRGYDGLNRLLKNSPNGVR
jgi:hypothetical protein